MKKIIALALLVASFNAAAQSQNYIVDNVKGGVTICNVQPVGAEKFVMCY